MQNLWIISIRFAYKNNAAYFLGMNRSENEIIFNISIVFL